MSAQTTTLVPIDSSTLAHLFTHPDFVEGVWWGKEAYGELHRRDGVPFTDQQIIRLAQENLSQESFQQVQAQVKAGMCEPTSVFYLLGYVVGHIEESFSGADR